VVFVPGSKKPKLIAVGPSGSDYSTDGGESWRSISLEGFHSASFTSLNGWAVGEAGRIAVYSNPRALAEKQE
jgi:hypothetical protein